MNSIALVLDSTVYKQSPQLNTQLFQYLRKQCRVGIFKLYIPLIVEREFLTWLEDRVTETYSAIAKAVQSLGKVLPSQDFLGVDFLDYFADSQLSERKNQAIQNWENFKTDTQASLLLVEAHHGKQVMDAYFEGSRPYSKRKSREDIPDAFIRAAIMDLLSQNKRLYLVSRDTRFGEAFSDVAQVCVSPDLAELFKIPEIAEQTGLITGKDAVESSRRMLMYYRDEFRTMIAKAIQHEIDAHDIGEQFFESHMMDPSTMGPVDVVVLDLNQDNISAMAEGVLLIPLYAEIKVEVYYGTEASDLQGLGKPRVDKLVSREESDLGYYDIVEAFAVKIKGNISMKISENDPKTWTEVAKEVEFRLENYDFIWV